MHTRRIFLILTLFLLLSSGAPLARAALLAGYNLSHGYVNAVQPLAVHNGSYSVVSAVGQPVIGLTSAAAGKLVSGYPLPPLTEQKTIYLPIVRR